MQCCLNTLTLRSVWNTYLLNEHVNFSISLCMYRMRFCCTVDKNYPKKRKKLRIFKNWKLLKKTTFYLVFALVKKRVALFFCETWLFSRAFWSESREKRDFLASLENHTFFTWFWPKCLGEKSRFTVEKNKATHFFN